MEVDKKLLLTAGAITALLFATIFGLNTLLNERREEIVLNRMQELTEEFSETQTMMYLMQAYGENVTCIALREQMSYLDEKIWKLGNKIDSYQKVVKEYSDNPFYLNQKSKFNRQEVMYLSMMKEMKQECEINQTIVVYFYGRCDEGVKCDEQSYVLTYINERIDDEIALFSFDTDLNVASVGLLKAIYNITELPAIVVEEHKYEGFHNKNEVESILCNHSNLSICKTEGVSR